MSDLPHHIVKHHLELCLKLWVMWDTLFHMDNRLNEPILSKRQEWVLRQIRQEWLLDGPMLKMSLTLGHCFLIETIPWIELKQACLFSEFRLKISQQCLLVSRQQGHMKVVTFRWYCMPSEWSWLVDIIACTCQWVGWGQGQAMQKTWDQVFDALMRSFTLWQEES